MESGCKKSGDNEAKSLQFFHKSYEDGSVMTTDAMLLYIIDIQERENNCYGRYSSPK